MTTKAERDHNDIKVLTVGLSIYVFLSLAIPTALHVMDRYEDKRNGDHEIHLHFGDTCTGELPHDILDYHP